MNENEYNPTEQVKRTSSSEMQHSLGNRGDLLPKSFLEDEKEGRGVIKIQESPALKLNFQSWSHFHKTFEEPAFDDEVKFINNEQENIGNTQEIWKETTLQADDEFERKSISQEPPLMTEHIVLNPSPGTRKRKSVMLKKVLDSKIEKRYLEVPVKKNKRESLVDVVKNFMKKLGKIEEARYINLNKDQHAMIRDNASFKFDSDEEVRVRQKLNLKRHLYLASEGSIKGSRISSFTKKISNILEDPFLVMKIRLKKFWNKAWESVAPDRKSRVAWDCYCMLLIFYQLVLIPLRLSFEIPESKALSIIDDFINVSFMLDIIFNFNTGFYYKGLLVMDKKKILKNYLKLWFWLDALTSVPYEWVYDEDDSPLYASGPHRLISIVRFLRFLKLVRLIRIIKLQKIFQKLESYIDLSPTVISLIAFIKLSIVTLFIAHWIACIWHFTAMLEFGVEPDTWLTVSGVINESWELRYVSSIYWAVTTMITVGYGDITPVTPTEKLLAVFTMIISSGVFAYTMNRINLILTGLDNTTSLYKQTMVTINKYMKKKQVNKELQIKIKKYLEYALNEETSLSIGESSIHTILSESLKKELINEIHGRVLMATPLFYKVFDRGFLAKIAFLMQEKLYSPEDMIFIEESVENLGIYFVNSGKVELFTMNSHSLIKTLGKGVYFGEISFFSGWKCSVSARSADFSTLYYINREEFVSLLQDHPPEKEKFCHLKDKLNLYEEYTSLNIKCFSCDAFGHMAKDCPLLHFVVNREQFISDYLISRKDWAKQFVRRKRPSYEVDRYELMKEASNRLQRRLENGWIKLVKSPGASQTQSQFSKPSNLLLLKRPFKERSDSNEPSSAQNQSFLSASEFPENIEGFEEHSLPVLVPSMVSPQINAPMSSERFSRFSRLSLSNLNPHHGISRSVCLSAEASDKLNERLRRKSDSGATGILKGKTPKNKLISKIRAIAKLTNFGVKQKKVFKAFEMDIDKIFNFTYYFPHNNFSSLYPYSNIHHDFEISPFLKYSSIYDVSKDH